MNKTKKVLSVVLALCMLLPSTGLLYVWAVEEYYWPVDTSIDYNHKYLYDAKAKDSIHGGVDFPCAIGTPVYASTAGTIRIVNNGCTGSHNGQKYAPVCTKSGCPGSFGNYIYVSNSEGRTLYAHLSGFAVSSGEHVEAGQLIGYSGNAGNTFGAHLHFEVQLNNKRLTCDPLTVLKKERAKPEIVMNLAPDVDVKNAETGLHTYDVGKPINIEWVPIENAESYQISAKVLLGDPMYLYDSTDSEAGTSA